LWPHLLDGVVKRIRLPMTRAVDICDVVRTPGVSASLANGTVTVKIGDHYAPVRVRRVKTPMPCSMWLLLCPVCRRQCRELHTMDGGRLACRVCAKVRHPDQRTSGSELGRIQRWARQIRRLETRLACKGPDRNTRRRLRRRRQRLQLHLASVLACRRIRMRLNWDEAIVAAKRGTQ
jgi:hypothetical protein